MSIGFTQQSPVSLLPSLFWLVSIYTFFSNCRDSIINPSPQQLTLSPPIHAKPEAQEIKHKTGFFVKALPKDSA